MEWQRFEMARRHSHDTVEKTVPCTPPRPLTLEGSLVIPGANRTQKPTQRNRETDILRVSVPDSPHEPDPEPYEPMPPRLIPLDEDSSMLNDTNLMVNLSNSSRSPQATNTVSNPVPPTVNVQELLSSIMGAQGNQSSEDFFSQLNKYLDFSDKIKQLLGSLQQTQNQGGPPPVNQGWLGHGPGMNNMNNMNMHMQMPMNGGYPPNNPPEGSCFNHPPPPHNHGPPFNAGGGPCMTGPPPGNYWGDESMRGGPHRGRHFHRGGRGRGGDPRFRGWGRGGPRGGHNNMNDMSKRPVCRHFVKKGRCRYESSCAFYHPGVNGPPLPPNDQVE